MTITPAQLTKIAIAALEDMKGANIEILDVTPLTSIADHMIICTGTSNRHVKALADSVMEKAREAGVRPLTSQGLEQGEWALVDLNGTLVHVMQASARATYQLEKLWDLGQPKPKLDEPKPAKPAKSKVKVKAKAKPAAKAAAASKKPAAKKSTAKPMAKKSAPKKAAKPVAKAALKAKPAAKKPAAPALKKPLVKAAAKPAVKAKAVAKKASAKKAVAAKPKRR
jgi:ribosome-associated protein